MVLLALASAAYAASRLFVGFSFYDDEGSLVLMSRWLFEGHPVYREFHSIYGPFYFLYKWVAHSVLGGVVSHSAARLIAVVPWTLTALLAFGYTMRATGSWVAALAAWFVSLRMLAFIAAEPGHPQEICILLVLALVAVAAIGNSGPRPWQLAAAGAISAALTLTKINLGIYVGAGLILAVLAATRGRIALTSMLLVAAACIAAPTCVMLPLLGQSWARGTCALITASIVPVVAILIGRAPDRVLAGSHWRALTSGFLVCAVAVLVWVIARGASADSMVRSIVLENVQDSHTWTVPLGIGAAGAAAAVAGLITALLWLRGGHSRTFEWIKLGVGSAVLLLVLQRSELPAAVAGRAQAAFAIGLPFVWLVLVPPRNGIVPFHRVLLASVMVLHALNVYPVASSQLRFTMVLLGIVAIVCLHDALTGLAGEWAWLWQRRRRAGIVLATMPVVAYLFLIAGGMHTYARFAALGLPGTTGIHIDPDDRALYRWVIDNVAASCDSLVSFPAMHSFYLWSGKVPPVYPDVDGWQPYLNRTRQAVERRLLDNPRACVVLVDKLVPFWLPPEDTARRTLLGFIRDHFVEQNVRDGFHLLVRKANSLN
jgi:hypothetical protein